MFLTLNEADPVGSAFASLIGLPAWGVQKGQGSMLTFEFGAPHLSIREPIANPQTKNPRIRRLLKQRQVIPRGEWYLWIGICHWQCIENDIVLSADMSPDAQITEAAKFLNGQKLVSVEVEQVTGKTIFIFDLNARLETWPYDGGDNDEQWSLYTPSNYVLSYRADGCYSWTPSDAPPQGGMWKVLPQKR
jgi:hypothetical protein